MTRYFTTAVLGVILGAGSMTHAAPPPTQAPPSTNALPAEMPENESGMIILARGPIHEAYAQPHSSTPKPGQLVPRQPPELIREIPPNQKPAGDNVQWIPGYWSWDSEKSDFIWASGIWRMPPADRRWVPGHWSQANGGWRWVAGFWIATAETQLTYLPAPPVSLETGPSTPAPEDNFYVEGTWVSHESGYAWRPGHWLAHRRGHIWTPARHHWTPAGNVFVDGYWDRPLEDRGLLFAPVQFDQPLWEDEDWTYQPDCVFDVGFTEPGSSLFVRPAWDSYYVGDYFDVSYTRLGFLPWWSYGSRFRDPLFTYYGWHHRGDPGWLTGIRTDFTARRNGTLPKPPRTWVDQVRKPAGGKNGHDNHLRPLTSLNQHHGPRLTSLNTQQHSRHQAGAQRTRNLAANRQRSEHRQAGANHGSTRLPAHSTASRSTGRGTAQGRTPASTAAGGRHGPTASTTGRATKPQGASTTARINSTGRGQTSVSSTGRTESTSRAGSANGRASKPQGASSATRSNSTGRSSAARSNSTGKASAARTNSAGRSPASASSGRRTGSTANAGSSGRRSSGTPAAGSTHSAGRSRTASSSNSRSASASGGRSNHRR